MAGVLILYRREHRWRLGRAFGAAEGITAVRDVLTDDAWLAGPSERTEVPSHWLPSLRALTGTPSVSRGKGDDSSIRDVAAVLLDEYMCKASLSFVCDALYTGHYFDFASPLDHPLGAISFPHTDPKSKVPCWISLVMSEAVRKHRLAILHCGGRGSGKSQSTRAVIQHFMHEAGGASPSTVESPQQLLCSKLLFALAILDRFTCIRASDDQPNASRSLRTLHLQVDSESSILTSARINCVLCDAARVSRCDEDLLPCFNVFYQIMTGADPKLRESLSLPHSSEHYILTQLSPDAQPRSAPEDSEGFAQLVSAWAGVGLSMKDFLLVLRGLATVVKLSEIAHRTTVPGAQPFQETEEWADVCSLLGLPTSSHEAFTGGSGSAFDTAALCVAGARVLYSSVVQWLVEKLNTLLHEAALSHTSAKSYELAIIDTPGPVTGESSALDHVLSGKTLYKYCTSTVYDHVLNIANASSYNRELLNRKRTEAPGLDVLHMLGSQAVNPPVDVSILQAIHRMCDSHSPMSIFCCPPSELVVQQCSRTKQPDAPGNPVFIKPGYSLKDDESPQYELKAYHYTHSSLYNIDSLLKDNVSGMSNRFLNFLQTSTVAAFVPLLHLVPSTASAVHRFIEQELRPFIMRPDLTFVVRCFRAGPVPLQGGVPRFNPELFQHQFAETGVGYCLALRNPPLVADVVHSAVVPPVHEGYAVRLDAQRCERAYYPTFNKYRKLPLGSFAKLSIILSECGLSTTDAVICSYDNQTSLWLTPAALRVLEVSTTQNTINRIILVQSHLRALLSMREATARHYEQSHIWLALLAEKETWVNYFSAEKLHRKKLKLEEHDEIQELILFELESREALLYELEVKKQAMFRKKMQQEREESLRQRQTSDGGSQKGVAERYKLEMQRLKGIKQAKVAALRGSKSTPNVSTAASAAGDSPLDSSLLSPDGSRTGDEDDRSSDPLRAKLTQETKSFAKLQAKIIEKEQRLLKKRVDQQRLQLKESLKQEELQRQRLAMVAERKQRYEAWTEDQKKSIEFDKLEHAFAKKVENQLRAKEREKKEREKIEKEDERKKLEEEARKVARRVELSRLKAESQSKKTGETIMELKKAMERREWAKAQRERAAYEESMRRKQRAEDDKRTKEMVAMNSLLKKIDVSI